VVGVWYVRESRMCFGAFIGGLKWLLELCLLALDCMRSGGVEARLVFTTPRKQDPRTKTHFWRENS
jgi:hypothetical protein